MGLFFKKKKIAEEVKSQEQKATVEKNNFKVSKIEQLPKEIAIRFLLFAKNTETEKMEAAIYRAVTKNDYEFTYDVLILTGENAGTLYSNIDRDSFHAHGFGSYYCRNLNLDNLNFEYLKVSNMTIDQKFYDPILDSVLVFDKNIVSLDELTTSLKKIEEIEDESKRVENLNGSVWADIDTQK